MIENVQGNLLEAKAEALVNTVYVDDAISGTSTTRRKAFQQLVEDAQKPGCSFQYVVVHDVKRFGRLGTPVFGDRRRSRCLCTIWS